MSPKATPRTHASKTELLRVRNIRSQRHIVPVPPQNEGARTRSSDEPSSNVSAYMSMYVHAQASATSLHRTLNLSANKYYYYYHILECYDTQSSTAPVTLQYVIVASSIVTFFSRLLTLISSTVHFMLE